MINLLRAKRWSPYLAGALLGMLTWFTFAVPKKAIGVSTNFSQAIRLAEESSVPEHAASRTYFNDYKVPKTIGWEAALAVGILLGAAVSAYLSGTRAEVVPELWARRFGKSRLKLMSATLLGGVLIAYGARLAGGCTSGHGISGTLQLAVSSWVFFLSLFAAGLATATLIYRKES